MVISGMYNASIIQRLPSVTSATSCQGKIELKHRANEGGVGEEWLPKVAKDTIYISHEQEQIWGVI